MVSNSSYGYEDEMQMGWMEQWTVLGRPAAVFWPGLVSFVISHTAAMTTNQLLLLNKNDHTTT